MKRFTLALGLVLSLAVPLLATATKVTVRSLGVSGDIYNFKAYNSSGTLILPGGFTHKTQGSIASYYSTTCPNGSGGTTTCYNVPLSVAFPTLNPSVIASVVVDHDDSGGQLLESIIEILN